MYLNIMHEWICYVTEICDMAQRLEAGMCLLLDKRKHCWARNQDTMGGKSP